MPPNSHPIGSTRESKEPASHHPPLVVSGLTTTDPWMATPVSVNPRIVTVSAFEFAVSLHRGAFELQLVPDAAIGSDHRAPDRHLPGGLFSRLVN